MPPLIQQFISQHPVYWGILAFGAGTMGPKLLDYVMTSGVDWVVIHGLACQKRFLVLRGISPDKIKILEERESAMLARAADDVKKDADDAKEAA